MEFENRLPCCHWIDHDAPVEASGNQLSDPLNIQERNEYKSQPANGRISGHKMRLKARNHGLLKWERHRAESAIPSISEPPSWSISSSEDVGLFGDVFDAIQNKRLRFSSPPVVPTEALNPMPAPFAKPLFYKPAVYGSGQGDRNPCPLSIGDAAKIFMKTSLCQRSQTVVLMRVEEERPQG